MSEWSKLCDLPYTCMYSWGTWTIEPAFPLPIQKRRSLLLLNYKNHYPSVVIWHLYTFYLQTGYKSNIAHVGPCVSGHKFGKALLFFRRVSPIYAYIKDQRSTALRNLVSLGLRSAAHFRCIVKLCDLAWYRELHWSGSTSALEMIVLVVYERNFGRRESIQL